MPLDLTELRAMLTEYFAKYHPFRLTAVAKKGGVLPPHTMRLYGDAPRTLSLLLSELDRLTAELAVATRPYLILDDPEGIIGCVEATSPEAAWEAFKAANPHDYDGDPADNDVMIRRITAELYDSVVDDLEIARSELAAAQAELTAYRRIPVPVAPQVIQLHQAWEGTTTCLHCGAPMPWEGMEVCPRGQAELTAARRGPVVEWHPTTVGEAARLGIGDLVESGPETGPEGKDKWEAAYRRAAGLA